MIIRTLPVIKASDVDKLIEEKYGIKSFDCVDVFFGPVLPTEKYCSIYVTDDEIAATHGLLSTNLINFEDADIQNFKYALMALETLKEMGFDNEVLIDVKR